MAATETVVSMIAVERPKPLPASISEAILRKAPGAAAPER